MFPKIKEQDIINCRSWMDICDCNYEYDYPEEDDIPPSGVIYCNIEHITKLFQKCQKTDNRYVVVSGFSDFGPAIQKEHPVATDMIKFLPFMYGQIADIGYQSLKIGTRCDVDRCSIDDAYSIKCYSYTNATFNEIPKNIIKWFVVNPMLMKNNIQGIPLGVGKDATPDILSANRYAGDRKKNWLYANWQNYTNERMHLKRFFLNNAWKWATVLEEPNRNYQEYLDDLASHFFVVCPEGNGIDCYRILESIYVGSIPIVLDSPTIKYFHDLPILKIDDWGQINSLDFLKNKLDEFSDINFSFDKIKLSYWSRLIRETFNEDSD